MNQSRGNPARVLLGSRTLANRFFNTIGTGSSISRAHKNARSSVAAWRRLYGTDTRSRLARLTHEDEVSELRIVGALFRTLASGQRTARSLLYVNAATASVRAAPEPFIMASFLSHECFATIFVANWYPRTW